VAPQEAAARFVSNPGRWQAERGPYPLRLRTSTKLGYKNAKWIKAIEIRNEFRDTYWSERGFNWYAGI
jgi:DMSO/TMAO reductase YedYZ molybdopterin-dependent catalytic subunit